MLCLYPSMLAECSFVRFTLPAHVVFCNSSLLRFSFLFFPCHTCPQFNKAGLLAWVHTCYFYPAQQAGWGPHPTLVYSLLGGDALHSLPRPLPCRVCRCHPHCTAHCQGVLLPPSFHYVYYQGVSLPPSFHYYQGVSLPPLLLYSVLGVLLPPLLHALYGVCCCHPCFTPGCTQQPLVPFTAKDCVFYLGLHSSAIKLLMVHYGSSNKFANSASQISNADFLKYSSLSCNRCWICSWRRI